LSSKKSFCYHQDTRKQFRQQGREKHTHTPKKNDDVNVFKNESVISRKQEEKKKKKF
jgi:hypothetical protein